MIEKGAGFVASYIYYRRNMVVLDKQITTDALRGSCEQMGDNLYKNDDKSIMKWYDAFLA
ncbi:MAG: hypothetical protein LIO99_02940 [Clostridiales bacterium]|nr:hypothetical protein [Clostridiales bacterium]